MIGAEAVHRTLVAAGVDVCFMNPGTSEMHFVAALDRVPEMRSVLVLFEGVASGAADGYGRMAGRPAAMLVHLGPGLGNSIANLHNARRARSPVVAIVGDHATFHKGYDSVLDSDVETLAVNPSEWIRRCGSSESLGDDVAEAVSMASGPPRGVATLILPADVSWNEGAKVGSPMPVAEAPRPAADTVEAIAAILRGDDRVALLVGGPLLADPESLRRLDHIRTATDASVLTETFPARTTRGGGLPSIHRLGYRAEWAEHQLADVQHLVLVGTVRPVASFAYPDQASDLVPPGCQVHVLADFHEDGVVGIADLGAALELPAATGRSARTPREAPASGPLDPDVVALVLGNEMREGTIVSDESQTLGMTFQPRSAASPPHDWLCLTGGAIGQGLPAAVGAAVACPSRPVLALQADGSAMYTNQALWTMAREGLDITVVLLANRRYAILDQELARVGANPGERSQAMFDLAPPELDFVALGHSMGVPSVKADTVESLRAALRDTAAEPGPHLVAVDL